MQYLLQLKSLLLDLISDKITLTMILKNLVKSGILSCHMCAQSRNVLQHTRNFRGIIVNFGAKTRNNSDFCAKNSSNSDFGAKRYYSSFGFSGGGADLTNIERH